MEFESLKSSKFDNFQPTEILSNLGALHIMGGKPTPTQYTSSGGGSGADSINTDTKGDGTHTVGGSSVDYERLP